MGLGRARDRIHAERGQPAQRVALDRARVAERREKADDHRTALEPVQLGVGGLGDAHDDVGVGDRGRLVGGDARTSGGVGVVEEAGGTSGIVFDRNGDSGLDEFRDGFRHERDTALARSTLAGDGDFHDQNSIELRALGPFALLP